MQSLAGLFELRVSDAPDDIAIIDRVGDHQPSPAASDSAHPVDLSNLPCREGLHAFTYAEVWHLVQRVELLVNRKAKVSKRPLRTQLRTRGHNKIF